MSVRLVVCLGAAALLATSCYDEDPGTVVAIVHGVGSMTTPSFDLSQGTFRVEEISEPAACLMTVTVQTQDGATTLTTITPSGPAAPSNAPASEDASWTGSDVDVTAGTYVAVGKAPKGCAWSVRVATPSD
ncbi:MAG TPA: hypothetical protein VFO60_08915 [Candidatus Dormibacteraeota bacterium]|nr:hypothetical protein [Candidatus Dormibacteraeota bacterium]